MTTARARVARESVEECLAVVERLHAVDAVRVDAGDVRPARARAGGEDEVVEAESVRPAGAVVAHLHLAPVEVEVDRLERIRRSMPLARCCSGVRATSRSTSSTTPPTQ